MVNMTTCGTMNGKSNEPMQPTQPTNPQYTIQLTRRFLTISLLISLTIALTVGRIARVILIDGSFAAQTYETPAVTVENTVIPPDDIQMALPTPLLLEGKSVPTIIYTAKHFDTSKAATTTSQFLEKQDLTMGKPTNDEDDTSTTIAAEEPTCGKSGSEGECADESQHLPAGQHLLVDIANVSYSFLNSEVRLAQAMIDVVNLSKLTLLSYHCHSLIPVGVSCVGVLLESHVSFHTWPVEGVITLDLFTCGSGRLVPVLPIIERLFAIPREDVDSTGVEDNSPKVKWSHSLRGFRDGEEERNYLTTEFGVDYLGDMAFTLKEKVSFWCTYTNR